MHPHAELITTFYRAFQQLDWRVMNECYHEHIVFNDPVFRDLRGWRAGAMWRMLCARAKNFSLEFRDVYADEQTGSAYWQPTYTFSKTGNTVVNKIDASFRFQDGKIIEHTDRFDLWRWMRMAMGPTGMILGWLPPVQKKVRVQANAGLESFIKEHQLGAETVPAAN